MKRNANEFDTLNAVELHPLLRPKDEDHNNVKRAKITPLVVGDLKVNPYYDPRTEILDNLKPKKVLNLNESIERRDFEEDRAILQVQDAKLKEQEEEDRIYQERKDQGLVLNSKAGEYGWVIERPDWIEWWDEPLIIGNKYPIGEEDFELDMNKVTFKDINGEDNPISIYIEHPFPVKTQWNSKSKKEDRIYLTKEEIKKLRRNNRIIKQRDFQDKVKLGLVEPLTNKIKLKNMMNVLTNESIKNPTEVENRIRNEIEERKRVHDENNDDRKLTKEERNKKKEMKMLEDRANGTLRSVFIVKEGFNGKAKYKMDINGQQMGILGVCCVFQERVLMIIEGGEKAVSKYKNLIMNRIPWSIENIWEGPVQTNEFQKWTVYEFDGDNGVYQFLEKHGMGSYYKDICIDI